MRPAARRTSSSGAGMQQLFEHLKVTDPPETHCGHRERDAADAPGSYAGQVPQILDDSGNPAHRTLTQAQRLPYPQTKS